MSLPLERIDDQYEIVAKIKEGGMGEIYKVRHRLLDELRIVKVLHSTLEDTEELKERFAREARAAIRLRHPNIVQIFDFTVDRSGTGLIVMEYIHGTDLKQLIAQPDLPSLALTLEIARQGLRALGYLHRNGFVHRDVSPDNLMLSEDVEGRPLIKIIDLGIAKQHGVESQLTASGIFLGKFRYASPEHFGVQGPGGIEARSDLYTFGLVLYELLTGEHPIQGDSTSQLIGGHLFQPPRDFAETDPEQRVPEALRQVVVKTLAKDAADRFATAEEIIARLDDLRARHPVDAAVTLEAKRFAAGGADAPALGTAITVSKPSPTPSLGAPTSAPPANVGDTAPDDVERDPDPVEALVSEVDTLLQSGKLIEADRVLFQARESYGSTSELTTMKAKLDRLYQVNIETLVREQIAQANELADNADFAGALKILDKARAAAPPSSSLLQSVETAITTIGEQRDSHRRSRGIANAERRLVQLIGRRDLTAAKNTLDNDCSELGEGSDLRPLRQLLAKTIEEHIKDLVQRAGIAHDENRFADAADCLTEILELDPKNRWIRDRLQKVRASQAQQAKEQQRLQQQDSDARALLQQAQTAHRERDVLKARVLIARALELRPDDADMLDLARSLDREHRNTELQLRGLRTTPLSPALMQAFTDIETMRAQGDPVAAWQLLKRAIETFGEVETFTQLRRKIAEEVLNSGEKPT